MKQTDIAAPFDCPRIFLGIHIADGLERQKNLQCFNQV